MTLAERRDTRTPKKFAVDMARRTLKEGFLVRLYAKEMEYKGSTVDIYDNGVDNSGAVIKGRGSTAADFRLVIDGKEGLYEIKCGPVITKATFKVHCLKSYVKQKAKILLFLGGGYIDKDPTSINYDKVRWAIIQPKKIQAMLDDHEHYNEFMFGGKSCVQIAQPNFHKYFRLKRLTHI